MNLLRKQISINPAQVGYLYREHRLERKLGPGIYKFFDFSDKVSVVFVPTVARILTITNQEVLTKDNIALRFSYFVEYQIINGDKLLSRFDVFGHSAGPSLQADQVVHNFSQGYLREVIAALDSEALNEKRAEPALAVPDELQHQLGEYGLAIIRIALRDITFPKAIQDLFAKQLEARIRARGDLEVARSAVATARAMKNASELIKGDENIKFMQFLETLTKIADKGKHTFVIGDVSQSGIAAKVE